MLILGATLTDLSAFDTLFQIDSKKNTYKLVLVELRSIRSDFVYSFLMIKPTNGERQVDDRVLQELFRRYFRANFVARDLIGMDTGRSRRINT